MTMTILWKGQHRTDGQRRVTAQCDASDGHARTHARTRSSPTGTFAPLQSVFLDCYQLLAADTCAGF